MFPPPLRQDEEVSRFYSDLRTFFLMDEPNRRSERISVTIPVVVSSLDEVDSTPAITNYAISRDLSQEGIGLVMSNPIGRDQVILEIQPPGCPSFEIVANVIHSTQVGYYYHVGMEFVVSDPQTEI